MNIYYYVNTHLHPARENNKPVEAGLVRRRLFRGSWRAGLVHSGEHGVCSAATNSIGGSTLLPLLDPDGCQCDGLDPTVVWKVLVKGDRIVAWGNVSHAGRPQLAR